MTASPSPAAHRRGRGLRVALAAALVAGLGAAVPSLAAEGDYTDAEGFLTAPAPLSAGDLAYDFATCPDAPPSQGLDVWAYELPADVAAPGVQVTVTGTDAVGPVDLVGFVYQDDCTYTRTADEGADGGLSFVLEGTERRLTVSTTNGTEASLLLTAGGAASPEPTGTPTATPTTDPGTGGGSGPAVRRDYSGGVDDPLYPEDSTGPASLEFAGQWGMRIVQAEQAWQEQRATGAGITVAVLDSGLDVGHPDFSCDGKVQRLDAQRYPRFADVTDTDGHGTHVAGIVGACTDNGEGVVGTAPDAAILPVQALSPEEATAERLAAAIDAATESGAHVINMSLGFSASGVPATGSALALLGGFAGDVDPAIQRAVDAGVVVVAAAGNESVPICGYPALADDVVCVGATDRRDLSAAYSNFPLTPAGTALMAPGGSLATFAFCDGASEGVLSTFSRDATACPTYPGYRSLDGTSMAAPHVAGVAALVYDRLGGERSPENAAAVIAAMTSTAVDLGAPGYDPVTGDGRVDALAAVQSVPPATGGGEPTGTPTPTPTPTDTGTPTPTPTETADPEVATTTVLVAERSGQTTDPLPVAARVEDATGAPLADVPVRFAVAGEGGSVEREAVTDEQGVAAIELPLDLAPGGYDLSATVDDVQGERTGSSARQVLTVTRDVPALSASYSGNGAGTRVTGVLTDQDSATGLAGRELVLVADGTEAGRGTSDDSGTVVFAPTGRDRNARSYEVRFAGDGTYEPATGTSPGRNG